MQGVEFDGPGTLIEQYGDDAMPMMSVAALSVPGLSVPVTVANGLPTSVQLLGGRFREDTLFDAGRAIEHRASVPSPVNPR